MRITVNGRPASALMPSVIAEVTGIYTDRYVQVIDDSLPPLGTCRLMIGDRKCGEELQRWQCDQCGRLVATCWWCVQFDDFRCPTCY